MTNEPNEKPFIGDTSQFKPHTVLDSEGNEVELVDPPEQIELEGKRYRVRAAKFDGEVMSSVGRAVAKVPIPGDDLDRFEALVVDELVTSLRHEHHRHVEFWPHWKHDIRCDLRSGDRLFFPASHRGNHPDLVDEDRANAQLDKMCGFLAEIGCEYEIREVDDGVRAVEVMEGCDG